MSSPHPPGEQSSAQARHDWIVGPRRADRLAAAAGIRTWDVTVNCHRRLRGPYTGVGTMLRTIVPQAWSLTPALVTTHLAAILCAAPELEGLIGSPPGTLTEHAPPGERTRWYSRLRTRRISHHLVDFLNEFARLRDTGELTLCFDTVHEADHSDQEFLAIALRRADPAHVRLAVASQDPDGSDLLPELVEALGRYAARIDAPAADQDDHSPVSEQDLACAFIDSDGTTDDPREIEAYARALETDPRSIAALHQARATELEAVGEISLTLGAIPYHVRNGAEHAYDAWPVYMAAEQYCMDVGFYARTAGAARRDGADAPGRPREPRPRRRPSRDDPPRPGARPAGPAGGGHGLLYQGPGGHQGPDGGDGPALLPGHALHPVQHPRAQGPQGRQGPPEHVGGPGLPARRSRRPRLLHGVHGQRARAGRGPPRPAGLGARPRRPRPGAAGPRARRRQAPAAPLGPAGQPGPGAHGAGPRRRGAGGLRRAGPHRPVLQRVLLRPGQRALPGRGPRRRDGRTTSTRSASARCSPSCSTTAGT